MTSTFTANPADRVRKIRLYRNGDENFIGKEYVLNPRQIRTYDRFLQSVTTHVGFGEAVRTVRTPRNGTVVQSLEDLENNHDYVAVGYGRFKSIGYVNIQERYVQRLRESRRHREEAMNLLHHDNRASGRIRKVITDVVAIYVYSNGDEMSAARKIILPFRMMQSWSTILAEINDHVNPQFSATRMLYTVDGVIIRHKTDIQNGGFYVAVGSRTPFKPLEYGKYAKPAFTVSPRLTRRHMTSDMALLRRYDKTGARLHEDGSSAESSSLPPLSTQSDPVTDKQRTRHMRRSRDPKLLMYHDGQDVFHHKPVKISRTQRANVDYDKDDGGVFKAKTKRKETQDANEINETNETRVDLPVDMTAAEQVEDEEVEEEDEAATRHRDKLTNRSRVSNNKNTMTQQRQVKVEPSDHVTPRTDRTSTPGPSSRRAFSPVQDRQDMSVHGSVPAGSPTPRDRTMDVINDEQPQQPMSRSPTPGTYRVPSQNDKVETARSLSSNKDEETALRSPTTTPRSQTPLRSSEVNNEADEKLATPLTSDDKIVLSPRSPTPRSPIQMSPTPRPMSQASQKDDRKQTPVAHESEKDANESATKIQSAYRGYRTRKQLKATP